VMQEFIRTYPQQLSTFNLWREGLADLLGHINGTKVNLWQTRSKKFFLLEEDGCARFAGAWLKNDKVPNVIFEEAGFEERLARSGFLMEVHKRLLSHTSKQLIKNMMNQKELERVLKFVESKNKTFRFSEKYAEIANSLLLPFANDYRLGDIQETIHQFLIHHLKDPRIFRQNWFGVSEKAQSVILRWIVGATLEDFFDLIDEIAKDAHWQYRRAFWQAYLRDISDAWIVLGPKAVYRSKRLIKDGTKPRHGRIVGGGIQSNQSVLLLKIGGMTISEWTHDGACRTWTMDSNDAPAFHKTSSYTRSELVGHPDPKNYFRHDGSVKGKWQREIASWIFENTGIRVKQKDYMPR